jgi:hypothetical protein
VTAGAARWNSSVGFVMAFVDAGDLNGHSPLRSKCGGEFAFIGGVQEADGLNEIGAVFVPQLPATLAWTCWSANPITGQMLEVDTIINGSAQAMPLPLTSYGRQGLAHEFGHRLGLDHECNLLSVMCPLSSFGSSGFCDPAPNANCIDPQTDDRNGVWNLYRDSDLDGCVDLEEDGYFHAKGGQRDKTAWWDFFDVPVPVLLPGATTGVRNKAINISDQIAILSYIGVRADLPNYTLPNGARYGSDLNGNGQLDGAEYDRSPNANQPWRPFGPSGSVSISDVTIAGNSIGDSCVPGP